MRVTWIGSNGPQGLDEAQETAALLTLASQRAPADRARLLDRVTDFAASRGETLSGSAREVLGVVLLELIRQAEEDLRLRLALRIASAPWAPEALVLHLVHDEVEIARPLISASPLLKDTHLIQLLLEASIEHQIEVARRPSLSGPVVETILEQAEPAVLGALVANTDTQLLETHMARLVQAARRLAGLRGPLARRSELSAALGAELQTFVGEALRSALAERFPDLGRELSPQLALALGDPRHSQGLALSPQAPEARLVAKLAAAGRLGPDFLVRALREDRLALFAHGLARRSGLPLVRIWEALCAPDPEQLALASIAAGIDRSAFPDVLRTVRRLNGGAPGADAAGARRAAQACLQPAAQARARLALERTAI